MNHPSPGELGAKFLIIVLAVGGALGIRSDSAGIRIAATVAGCVALAILVMLLIDKWNMRRK
jgi:membrane associated rhomboid family serine protease